MPDAPNPSLDALAKIVRAQQRGTLPTAFRIAAGTGYVDVTSAGDAALPWFRKHFPGGNERLAYKGGMSRGHRRVTPDTYEYRAPLGLTDTPDDDGVTRRYGHSVCLRFTRDHQCEAYAGHVNDAGRPVWRCTACRKPITKTRARELGLLPARLRDRDPADPA